MFPLGVIAQEQSDEQSEILIMALLDCFAIVRNDHDEGIRPITWHDLRLRG